MNPEQAKRLGAYLRQRRLELGLTVRQLAAEADTTDTTVVRLEQGAYSAPAADKLARLAGALGLSLADVYALADYAVPADLPGPVAYLRAKYRDLPARELAALSRDIEAVMAAHGITLGPGPAPGEDETPEAPPRTRTTKPSTRKKGGAS